MTEDIRVKLSPEGVKEVIDALRRVQREGRSASGSAAKDVGILTAALRELKGLLPTIGLGAIAYGIYSIGKNAVDTADHLAKLKQSVGGTVEDLSALSLGAALSNVDQDKFERGLIRLSRSIGEVTKGTQEQTDAFEALGLTARDFIGKNAVQAFELVAQRVAGLEDPLKKVQVVQGIFGNGMSKLVPLLNAVGTQGMAKLREEAERLGLVMSSDLAKAAEDLNDHLTILSKRSEALAIQFLTGFVPALNKALEILEQQAGSKGNDAITKLGEAFGETAQFIVKSYLVVGKVIGATLAILEDKAQNLLSLTGRLAVGAAKGAALGAPAGAIAGSAFFGVGAGPGALAGAGAGAIAGAVNELGKPTTQRQHEIMDELSKDIEEILKKTDPAKLGPNTEALRKLLRGGSREDEGSVSASIQIKERIAQLEKRLNLDQLKDLADIGKTREQLDRTVILSERKVAEAKIAANKDTFEGQKAIEQAELDLLKAKQKSAVDAANFEIEIAKSKEKLLTDAVKRQFGATEESAKIINGIVKQSSKEQLDAETKKYAALVGLQDDYLQKYRASKQKIIAIDKEIADTRREVERISNDLTLQGLDEEGKKNLTARLAQERLGELQDAALRGDLEKTRELRREAISLGQQLAQLGDIPAGEKIVQRAQDLFELGANANKLIAQEAGNEAKKQADAIEAQLKQIKDQIDQLKANIIFDIAPVLNGTAMAALIKQIQAELNKEPFQIRVQAQAVEANIAGGTVIGRPGYAGGGDIQGVSASPFSDNIPIMATAHEFMQPVRAVKHYGRGFMEDVRNLSFPRLADGGMIGGSEGGGAGMRPIDVHLGGKTARVWAADQELGNFLELVNEGLRGT